MEQLESSWRMAGPGNSFCFVWKVIYPNVFTQVSTPVMYQTALSQQTCGAPLTGGIGSVKQIIFSAASITSSFENYGMF
jgi:hypothetical protein